MFQGGEALPEDIIRILKEILIDKDVIAMSDVIRDGTPLENIIAHFLKVIWVLLSGWINFPFASFPSHFLI